MSKLRSGDKLIAMRMALPTRECIFLPTISVHRDLIAKNVGAKTFLSQRASGSGSCVKHLLSELGVVKTHNGFVICVLKEGGDEMLYINEMKVVLRERLNNLSKQFQSSIEKIETVSNTDFSTISVTQVKD